MNLYVNVPTFKREIGGAGITGNDRDTEIVNMLERTSRVADDWCRRRFYSEEGVRYFDGNGEKVLWLPGFDDVISLTAAGVDLDGDGTFETALVENTDYTLAPYNATPKRCLAVRPLSTLLSRWPCVYPRQIRLTGMFGHSHTVEAVTTVNEAVDGSETDLTITAVSVAALGIGDTIVIDDEQMTVTGVTDNITVTVTRAVNGTAAATHTTSTTIYRRTFPGPIVQAVVLDAARMLREQATGYGGAPSGFSAGGDTGGFQFRETFPAIAGLRAPYKHVVMG